MKTKRHHKSNLGSLAGATVMTTAYAVRIEDHRTGSWPAVVPQQSEHSQGLWIKCVLH